MLEPDGRKPHNLGSPAGAVVADGEPLAYARLEPDVLKDLTTTNSSTTGPKKELSSVSVTVVIPSPMSYSITPDPNRRRAVTMVNGSGLTSYRMEKPHWSLHQRATPTSEVAREYRLHLRNRFEYSPAP